MSESMTEAVEGFEKDLEAFRALRGVPEIDWAKLNDDIIAGFAAIGRRMFIQQGIAVRYFSRDDVADVITAANDARQLAIQSPRVADQENARADRLTNLAERLAALAPSEGS